MNIVTMHSAWKGSRAQRCFYKYRSTPLCRKWGDELLWVTDCSYILQSALRLLRKLIVHEGCILFNSGVLSPPRFGVRARSGLHRGHDDLRPSVKARPGNE